MPLSFRGIGCVLALEQYHHLGADRFFAADRANPLARLGFEVHRRGWHREQASHRLSNLRLVAGKLRPLGEDGTIGVDGPPTLRADGRQDLGEHLRRTAITVRGIVVRKPFADVTQPGRTEQGVNQGVQQDVGIGMPYRTPIMRNPNAAEEQRPAGFQTMGIVPNANAKLCRSDFLSDNG